MITNMLNARREDREWSAGCEIQRILAKGSISISNFDFPLSLLQYYTVNRDYQNHATSGSPGIAVKHTQI
jgi:hypothetical protein